MPEKDLDSTVTNRFVVAASLLLRQLPHPPTGQLEPSVMFSTGPVGWMTRADLDREIPRVGLDIIHVEFEVGREGDGPANFMVAAMDGGRLRHWPSCAPWAFREDGPLVLVPRRGSICLGYDGTALRIVPERPGRHDLGPGTERARAILAVVAARVPPELLTQAGPFAQS